MDGGNSTYDIFWGYVWCKPALRIRNEMISLVSDKKKKNKLKKNNGQRPTLINEWITVTVLNELDAQKSTKLKALTMEVQN